MDSWYSGIRIQFDSWKMTKIYQNQSKFFVIIQIIDSLSISFCRMMEKWGIKGVILLYRAVGARNCPHPIMPHHPLLLPHPHRRPLQRLCWSNLQKRLVLPKIQVLSCQVSNQMIPRLSLCQGKYYCSFDVKFKKDLFHKYFYYLGC